MTSLDYAKEQLKLAEKILRNSKNGSEDVRKIAQELYYLCIKDVKLCESNLELFDIDYEMETN